jgi:hypothetical protein
MVTAAPKHECGACQAVPAPGNLFAATTLKPERTATASSENVRYDVFPPSEIDPTSMLRRRIARKT